MTATTRRHATQTDPEPQTPGGATPPQHEDRRQVDERWDFYRVHGTRLLREQARRRSLSAEVFTRQVA
jgi:hypothetical protein